MFSYLLERFGIIVSNIISWGMILVTFVALCFFVVYLVSKFRTSAKVRSFIIAVCVTFLTVFIIVRESAGNITTELIIGALCFIYVISKCICMAFNSIIKKLKQDNEKEKKHKD